MSSPKDPPKPSGGSAFLAGILKNAAQAPKHGLAPAKVDARVCSKCGAARAEKSDLKTCAFCGASFLDP